MGNSPIMKISRIGLIGLGKHGQRYAGHIVEDFPELELHAICRADVDRLKADEERWSARGFRDYGELIAAAGCDAIIAAVPPDLNLDIARRVMKAGLPLLLEKPAAANLDDARAMWRLARDASAPLMIGQTLRYNGVVRALRQRRAEIGRITSLSLTQRFEVSDLTWLDDPQRAGAGIALHTGVHSFDLVRYLSGLEVRRVMALAASVATVRTEDCCAAVLDLGDGVLATVSLARTSGGRTGHVEVAGEKGVLAGDHVANRAHVVRGREVAPIDVGGDIPTVRAAIDGFVRGVANGQVPIPLDEGVRAVAIADACLRSARSGRAEAVEPIA